ncbi:MAG: hypothetical protein FD177_2233 [Desulfovibrionaceae bacterium]|nr:MAG: hypothetical protein FD177_2233 [Desulfovibrionaceae bacterium]
MNVCIVGTGYVGLVAAAGLSDSSQKTFLLAPSRRDLPQRRYDTGSRLKPSDSSLKPVEARWWDWPEWLIRVAAPILMSPDIDYFRALHERIARDEAFTARYGGRVGSADLIYIINHIM